MIVSDSATKNSSSFELALLGFKSEKLCKLALFLEFCSLVICFFLGGRYLLTGLYPKLSISATPPRFSDNIDTSL